MVLSKRQAGVSKKKNNRGRIGKPRAPLKKRPAKSAAGRRPSPPRRRNVLQASYKSRLLGMPLQLRGINAVRKETGDAAGSLITVILGCIRLIVDESVSHQLHAAVTGMRHEQQQQDEPQEEETILPTCISSTTVPPEAMLPPPPPPLDMPDAVTPGGWGEMEE